MTMASKQSTLDKKANAEITSTKLSAKKSAGQLLRKARLAKGYKVNQVVQKLNISEEYIKAIEQSDFKKLPIEHTYTLGFVRAYAQLIGLDSHEIVELFKVDFMGVEEEHDPNAILVAPLPESKSTLPFMYIALGGAILIISMGYWVSKKPHGSGANIQVSSNPL
jgi:cytoskeleton protein RodZ